MAMRTKKKASFGTTMGVSSIIAILVILVLVVFSALSITTSKADLRLSEKTAASVKAFYDADAAAEDMMAEAAAAIAGGGDWRAELSENGYSISSATSGTLIEYIVPIDENRNLDVRLIADNEGGLTRKLWQVVPANEWVPDNSLNLYIPPEPLPNKSYR